MKLPREISEQLNGEFERLICCGKKLGIFNEHDVGPTQHVYGEDNI